MPSRLYEKMMGKDPNEYPENDRQLLDLIATGDQNAYRRLAELCWARVYFNTLTLVKTPAVAQELTQDIFLKLWIQRDKLREVANLHTYIYVLGRNQVISAMRKKIIATASLSAKDDPEDLHLPHLQLEEKDTYKIILQGIARLTPQQQTIFKMSRMDGLSHEEIAQQLQLSKNTVKVHMVAALNTLRTWLREHTDYGLAMLIAALAWLVKKYF